MNSFLAIVAYIAIGIVLIIAWVKIFEKAGYNRWLSLAMFIPILNAVVLLWFAFDEWPLVTSSKRRMKKYKSHEHTMVCDSCENPIKGHDKFCSSCGKEFEVTPDTCPSCKRIIDPDAVFCALCGASLRNRETQSEATALGNSKRTITDDIDSAVKEDNQYTLLVILGIIIVVVVVLIFVWE